MKLLVPTTLFALLIGCENPPQPTKLPPLPVEIVAPAQQKTKFVIGDKVILVSPSGKETTDGVIIAVGPIVTWTNPVTGEEFQSRAYLLQVVVDGKVVRGPVPEKALTLRQD